jgi:predicted ABC-type ATPase
MQTRGEPTVYVLAGPNGAGKTTFAMKFLPGFAECREFVNADLIAAGLSPFAPETQTIRAGRLLLTRIRELCEARCNFGFETTLSGRTHVSILKDMKTASYRIMLFFLRLQSADLAVARVANRVHQGGHNVPEDTIRRRFGLGLRNLFQLYLPLVDTWWLYDTSAFPPALVAHGSEMHRQIFEAELYESIQRAGERGFRE